MSVVLVAIGAALAMPSFRDMVEKRQVTNGAEQLASFMNTAQGVAIKTNEIVTVSWSRTADDDWCVGAVEGADACDCTETVSSESDYCAIASQPFIVDNSHAGDRDFMHNISRNGSYSFDPVRGLLTDLGDTVTMEFRSDSEDFRLNLMVNETGRVILCSADSDYGVPGYSECPAGGFEEGPITITEEPPIVLIP